MTFNQYHVLIERSGDTRDGLGRTTSSGSPTTIYDGNAEVQEQAVRKATENGNAVKVGDAQGWLPDSESITELGIQQGDDVTVTRPDASTFEATVATTKPLDDSFVLSKDRQA
jgi:hypothetical protein